MTFPVATWVLFGIALAFLITAVRKNQQGQRIPVAVRALAILVAVTLAIWGYLLHQ